MPYRAISVILSISKADRGQYSVTMTAELIIAVDAVTGQFYLNLPYTKPIAELYKKNIMWFFAEQLFHVI